MRDKILTNPLRSNSETVVLTLLCNLVNVTFDKESFSVVAKPFSSDMKTRLK